MMVLDSEGDIVDSLYVGDEHYVFLKADISIMEKYGACMMWGECILTLFV